MKDRTHSMNAPHGGEGSVNGYTDPGKPQTTRARKDRQMKWANLEDNEGLREYEGMEGADEDFTDGFLPRNNYEDRY